ncbi:SDR family NAD(P)-dependent oxidoreductase [Streptomyces guryensis]|uniref:SDR family NAD(P)-dependent oxidoreductase n=1 Tax=Streptomyces guryensis TaxID=2886947 RepID=A0A9Q3Z8T2_9ACTN|nr:SDR family NAD(P)-dependent oxidoreductase [Streptomyces guryensis]MCD9878938.1 SDR family NAD(P)-dependent oxidoreductase [Streptomyces guryensis]
MVGNERVALVTGATAGLGREVALALASRGIRVLAHGRDVARLEAVGAEVRAAGGQAETYLADLADLAQVRTLAQRVSADHPELTILVNNAGVGGGPPPHKKRELSTDGYELRFAVNYLAPVLLTRLLLPQLIAGAPARVVNVGSVGQAPPDFDDIHMERRYDGADAYFRSKFSLAAFTFDLADELQATDVHVNCVHPANFMDTYQVREAGIAPWTSAAAGVEPVLNLAIGRGGESTGHYFDGTRSKRAHSKTYKKAIRQELRQVTEDLLVEFL